MKKIKKKNHALKGIFLASILMCCCSFAFWLLPSRVEGAGTSKTLSSSDINMYNGNPLNFDLGYSGGCYQYITVNNGYRSGRNSNYSGVFLFSGYGQFYEWQEAHTQGGRSRRYVCAGSNCDIGVYGRFASGDYFVWVGSGGNTWAGDASHIKAYTSANGTGQGINSGGTTYYYYSGYDGSDRYVGSWSREYYNTSYEVPAGWNCAYEDVSGVLSGRYLTYNIVSNNNGNDNGNDNWNDNGNDNGNDNWIDNGIDMYKPLYILNEKYYVGLPDQFTKGYETGHNLHGRFSDFAWRTTLDSNTWNSVMWKLDDLEEATVNWKIPGGAIMIFAEGAYPSGCPGEDSQYGTGGWSYITEGKISNSTVYFCVKN